MPFVQKNDSPSSQPPTDAHKIFIGREDELLFFKKHILEPEVPTHNIISISGQGGVGKSTLLARFIDEAHSTNFKDHCYTAMVDERYTTPASIMEKFADQLRMTRKFGKMLRQYNETLRKLQSERETMQDPISSRLPDFAGSILEGAPFAGPLLREVVKAGTRHLLGRYHIDQTHRNTEILEHSTGELTKAFVEEINRLAEPRLMLSMYRVKRPRVILFFDTFEQLSVDAEPWLLDYFLEAKIVNTVVLVIAGRYPIEKSIPGGFKRWLPYHDSNTIYSISLEKFTEEETRLYLARRGITDPDRIAAIRQLSHD
jgi:Cdc6-like AAA superfamily ATPase